MNYQAIAAFATFAAVIMALLPILLNACETRKKRLHLMARIDLVLRPAVVDLIVQLSDLNFKTKTELDKDADLPLSFQRAYESLSELVPHTLILKSKDLVKFNELYSRMTYILNSNTFSPDEVGFVAGRGEYFCKGVYDENGCISPYATT